MIKVFRPVAWTFPISSPYGKRKDPVTGVESSMHYGVDFAVPVGTPIVAAIGGEVIKAGWQNSHDEKEGFGFYVCQYVRINNTPYQVYYGHMSHIDVKEGEYIEAGKRIGLSGNTGKSSGPHLHLEVRPIREKGVPFEFEGART
jgi:murein DD-endopeptidase MepM/ murein hydrolase activator NlpD